MHKIAINYNETVLQKSYRNTQILNIRISHIPYLNNSLFTESVKNFWLDPLQECPSSFNLPIT